MGWKQQCFWWRGVYESSPLHLCVWILMHFYWRWHLLSTKLGNKFAHGQSLTVSQAAEIWLFRTSRYFCFFAFRLFPLWFTSPNPQSPSNLQLCILFTHTNQSMNLLFSLPLGFFPGISNCILILPKFSLSILSNNLTMLPCICLKNIYRELFLRWIHFRSYQSSSHPNWSSTFSSLLLPNSL